MVTKVEANYPQDSIFEEDLESSEEYDNWKNKRYEQVIASAEHQEGMDEYYQSIADNVSKECGTDNFIYSPLNIYLSMALLAEVSAGKTKAEILKALNVKDMEFLRSQVKALWNANYINTPFAKSTLANSLWLRDDINCQEDVLKKLATDYYASSFIGTMGSDEMNHELQAWTNQNTGGLLADYVKDLKLDQDTVLGLVSTLLFKATWMDKFEKEETRSELFHGLNGDTQVQMMHASGFSDIFRRKHFKAAELYLNRCGSVYFFLPEEGIKAADILRDPEALAIIRSNGNQNSDFYIVNYSIPRFKISNSFQLQKVMEKFGIRDAFDQKEADFSAIIDGSDEAWVNSAMHSAMVEIDEEGVTGAAYTADLVCGMGFPDEETEFVLDRPFCFAITGSDRSILFSGVVNNIE